MINRDCYDSPWLVGEVGAMRVFSMRNPHIYIFASGPVYQTNPHLTSIVETTHIFCLVADPLRTGDIGRVSTLPPGGWGNRWEVGADLPPYLTCPTLSFYSSYWDYSAIGSDSSVIITGLEQDWSPNPPGWERGIANNFVRSAGSVFSSVSPFHW